MKTTQQTQDSPFTSGEWEIGGRGVTFPFERTLWGEPKPDNHFNIAKVFGTTKEEAEANARLIAEAPTMKKYIDYVREKVSYGSVPYSFEDWKEVGQPDYE